MKSANKILALMLAVLMIISAMPVYASADVSDFTDFPHGSWSEEAMTAAVNNHLLKGKGNGVIAPKDYLTRAEAAAIINRAFGATVKADISAFTDVQKGSWYYDEIAKAVNMQTIVGISATKADPQGYITRESMLVVLARALVLDEGDSSVLSKFTDGSSVSSWAKAQVAAMAQRGYVNGNEKGQLNPQGYITREEFAQIMHNIFKLYIPDNITINGGTYGTTVIRAKDVTLNNVIINGDLVAGDGIGDGNLNLTNVTVTGRILFRGGEGKVKLTNTNVGEKVVINDVNGVVNFLNYRAEEPFKNIQENTEATFLNMKVNTGGGGSSTPSRADYKIREYMQNIDGTYPQTASNSDEKTADYGKTVTYSARDITGFTFDATYPESVLSGVNKGKLVLKAYYTRNKYTVSFGGYEVELPYGQNISKDNPLKDKMQATIDENKEAGYNTEFNTKEDGTGKKVTIDDTTVGAEDLPIYAIKTPIEYKINYNLNGGKFEGTYDKTYNVEEEVILPVNVVKRGYTFDGWTDENGNPVTKIDVGTKGNKTFNAKWNIITYTITYVAGENGTMDGVTAKATYTVEDGKYTLPEPVVTKQDYVFKGWYEEADFSGKKITVLNPEDAENKTYYARIEERTYEQYTIKFDGKTYTVTEGEKIGDAVDRNGNKLGDAMDNVTYPKGYEADDFRIKGDDTTVITKDTVATGDMEIVAAKKATVYTITYELNGGTLDGTQKTTYTIEDADYTLPVPEKADYIFFGWYEEADFSGAEVKVLDTAEAENKIYHANWKKVTYTITFNGIQYTVEKDEKISEATDKNGNKLGDAMDNVTYPKGYEADGFHIKGNTADKVTKDTLATGNMEIEAAKKATTYTITYVLDGGILTGAYKTTYTVEDADYNLPKPNKANHEFLGWYDNISFSGNNVTVLDTADAENKTYYASWKYIAPSLDIYKITFDGNEYNVTENNALYTNAELKDAMEEALEKPGYDVSFNTKSDGTGEDIDTSYIPEGDMSIYIIEVAKEYTITYVENGGDDVADDTYTIEDSDITLPVPTRDGYVFRGWYEGSDFSGAVVTVLDTADLENKTYYAKWVLDNAVLSFDHEISGDVVTLKVMLNAIPADIDDIAAMSIRYDFDNTKLEYVSTTSNVGEVTAASAGYISWYTTSNYITADTLTAKDNVLFTVTFNVKDGQYGITEVSYTSAEITASVPVGNPTVSEKYTKESETIDLGTQVQTYTITYVENGGVEIPDGSYTANDADITLPIPLRADYAFKGWYEEADFSGEAVTVLDTADAEDKTYYAKWVIETATLGFSSEISGNTVKIYVTLDEIPSDIDEISAFTLKYKHPDNKLTYVSGATAFGGQFSSQDGYISWYNENNAITSDALKANGNIVATLEFSKTDSANGIEIFEYTDVEIVASEPVGNPAIATKYITEKKEVQLDAATYVVTFKGQTYNITAGNALSSNALLVAAMNEAANKSGYTVTFNTKADGTGENVTTTYVPSGSMEVYVVEDAIDYSITYELDGGALDGTQKTSYTVEDADYTLPTPTKANYDFLGWYEDGAKVDVLDTADAEDKTYTAKWEATEYTITYELDGGALDGTQKTSYTVEDADYTLPIPEKLNYEFLGWYEASDFSGDAVVVLDTADAENKTYYASWKYNIPALDVYKITFNGNDYDVTENNALLTNTNLKNAMEDAADKTGYTVVFNTKPDGTGENVTTAYVPTGDMEIFVIETPNVYTITYELDGGILDGTQKTSYTVEDADYTLPTPTKDGFDFLGWYEDGTEVTVLDTADVEDKTYTAKWEEISETVYTITYELGGIGEMPAEAWTEYKTSQLAYTLLSPGNTETHMFVAWYDNAEFTGSPVTVIAEGTTGDLKFYAKWEEIPEDAYTITYVTNGGTLDGTQKTSYTASQLPYDLPVPQKGEVPFLGWYEDEACTGEAVTVLAAGSTGNKTYYAKWQEYTLQFYLGTDITRNKPTSDDGDQGKMIVEHGATLTQADVDRELGMLPSEYKVQEGYVDSDGVVHEIVPELWYLKNGEWTKFVPEEVEIVSDMNIHLFIRFLAFEYNTDLQIKGIDVSKLDFSLDVPYDSYTDIGKTYLDFLELAGETLDRVLNGIEDQGYDLYQMAIDKAASKGLVDTDGNIMNPNVPVPLHRFITKERINGEIDKYIENNLDNEEFIADLLRNDSVVEMLLDDQSIRESVLSDSEMRSKLLTKSVIKRIISNDDVIDWIITNEDFKKAFIDSDATFDYIVGDLKTLLDNGEYHDMIIDACVEFVIDVYFEKTISAPELVDYIDTVLDSDEFIADIEARPELRSLFKNELKGLLTDLDDPSTSQETRDEVYAEIRNNETMQDAIIDAVLDNDDIMKDIMEELRTDLSSGTSQYRNDVIEAVRAEFADPASTLKSQIIATVKSDLALGDASALRDTVITAITNDFNSSTSQLKSTVVDTAKTQITTAGSSLRNSILTEAATSGSAIEGYIRDYASNSEEIKAEIKPLVKDNTDVKEQAKTWISTNIASVKNDIKSAMLVNEEALVIAIQKSYSSISDADAREYAIDYIAGTIEGDLKEEIDDNIDALFANDADVLSMVEDNFDTFYNASYDSIFDELYDDPDVFDKAYESYVSDPAKLEDSFDKYVSVDANLETAVNKFIEDTDNLADAIEIFVDSASDADIAKAVDVYVKEDDNLISAVNTFIEDDNNLNIVFDIFKEDDDNLKKAFDTYIADDDNLGEAIHTFASNAAVFDNFYEEHLSENAADPETFNELFEAYYHTHVHDVADKAWDNADLHDLIMTYVHDYTEDMVEDYADGSLVAEHPELVDTIDELMHERFPVVIREKYYEPGSTIKTSIDHLIEEEGTKLIKQYANDEIADSDTVTFIEDTIEENIDIIVDEYVAGNLDADVKALIDAEIDEYMEKLINDYISGTDRDTLGDLIPTYAQDAVDAIKRTDAFKNTIDDFVSGNGVRVNEDNLMFVEIIADVIAKYDYESLSSDFLPDKVKKVLDFVGKDVAEEYVNKYLDVFCTGINEALDNLNADIDAGIEGTEYKFSTSPAVRINYMAVANKYYTTLTEKLRDKVNSQSKIPVSSNPYAQRIVDMDYFALFFDKTGEETEYKSGYKLKDDIMEYYDNMVMLQVLVHDAVTFYGSIDTYTMEDRLDSASLLVGTYANKLNDVIMNFIENGELPKGYTLEDVLDIHSKIESLYNRFKDKIEKGEDLYAEYLDRDYTDIIDLANMSIYSGGDAYKIYQIVLENGEYAFDVDDAVTAVFDSPNYRGVSKIEDAMAKVEAKIKNYKYTPEKDIYVAYVDAYKGTVESREIKGFETGTHTVAVQRYLRYYK